VEHQALVARGARLLPPLSRQCGSPERLDDILRRLTAVSLAERFPNARRATSELADLLKLAPSLADGERSVRGRIAQLMQRLYPAEPARSRADFARRVVQARKSATEAGVPSGRPGIPEPSPAAPLAGPTGQGLVLSGTRYRLVKLIANGGMGEVWEAVHLDLGRSVALKLIPEAASRSAEARQRFRAEARAVARLDHPGLVKIHDFGVTADGRCYFAMELLEGETLQTRLGRGKLPWKQAVACIIEVTSALSAAHGAGIVHRDITPANLFITHQGTVKLLDFGVCHSFEHHSEARAGAPLVVGTPEYISPEQAAGAVPDARSDLYSLGVVLYEALTGGVPHPLGEGGAPSLAALLTAKITITPLAPALAAPDSGIPARLDRLVLAMLERDADKRPPSAQDTSGQLEALLHQGSRRQPRFALAALSAAIAFGTLAWVGFVLGHAEGQSLSSRDAALNKAENELVQLVAEARSRAVAQESTASERLAVPALTPEAVAPRPVEPGADEAATAIALGQRGQKIRAHHLMKEILVKYPDSAAVQRAAVTTARGVGAWGEAIEAARRWTVLEHSTESLIALARLQRATLDRGARATLEQALLADPDNREARKLLSSYGAEKVATR
jgi:eukaryotic-like serine/threonine-protein kinase